MADTLGKEDLAGRVATKLKGSHAQGAEALNAVMAAITEALAHGSSVTVTGFGTFEVREIGERQVRAIRGAQQGQLTTVQAHRRAAFRAGSELQRAVAGEGDGRKAVRKRSIARTTDSRVGTTPQADPLAWSASKTTAGRAPGP